MDWTMFHKHGEAPTGAFEAFANQLFELWCRREYGESVSYFTVVNGAGGDGGVEAYAMLSNGTYLGVQSKWFLNAMGAGEIKQIKNSIKTAMKIRPDLKHYIVCIPRDLSSKKAQAKKTEEDRWNELVLEMTESYPELTIDLWNEKRLRDEVQKDHTGNVYRYWFKNNEFSLETLKHQFAKAQSGWLNQRYIPSLHGQGLIQSALHRLVGDKSVRKEAMKILHKYETQLHQLTSEVQFGQTLYKDEEFNIELKKVEIFLEQLSTNVRHLKTMIKHDGESINFSTYDHPNINKCLAFLKEQPIKALHSINKSSLERALQTIHQMDLEYGIHSLHETFSNHQVLILGEPGTGKTHGLADGVQQYLEVMQRPAILIQAKRYGPEKSWRDILIDVLGISSNWSEDEVWRGLEACAARCDTRDAENDNPDLPMMNGLTSVLICIDGLDESIPWDRWKERIGELDTIQRNYRRLKFAITSRPYVFQEGLIPKALELPSEGDTSVAQLFPEYIAFYDISFSNADDFNWLRWSIKTPNALRLFCEQNKGKRLSDSNNVTYTIGHLLRDKINAVDKEMILRLENSWGTKDDIVLKALVAIANRAIEQRTFERSELCTIIVDAQPEGMFDKKTAFRLMDYMVDYGLLSEFVTSEQNPLSPLVRTYEITLQPMMDYLLAIQLVERVTGSGDNDLPKGLNYRQGTIQMAAIILLQDHKRLVGKDGLWDTSIYMDLFDLQLFTLANVTPDRTEPYVEEVKKNITHSMSVSRKIVNQLMVQVARNKSHPLGPNLLHKTLYEIESVAERDLFWSVPEYLPRKNGSIWEGNGSIFVNDANNGLLTSDTHDGLPLLYVWHLTNVDNRVRQTCRKELTKWGATNPMEFVRLIDLTFSTNDPQMKEDLVCCAFAVASTLTNQPELKVLADWALTETFAEPNIMECYNAVILYASRAIVEHAHLYGHVGQRVVEKARPPYPSSPAHLPIDLNAAQEDSEEFGPISMDLGWYVLKESYEVFFVIKKSGPIDDESSGSHQWSGFSAEELDWMVGKLEDGKEKDSLKLFAQQQEKEKRENLALYQSYIELMKEHLKNNFETDEDDDFLDLFDKMDIDEEGLDPTFIPGQYEDAANELLTGHAKRNRLESLTPHQLALGFAVSFIHRMGWDEKEFYGRPNGGTPGEVIGVDVSIMREYSPATHGSQSTVMQFAEKYAWCAVHDMLGYFASRIPLYVDGSLNRGAQMVEDYSLLLDIPNPLQELSDVPPGERRDQTAWFVPNDLGPTVPHLKSRTEKDITQWLLTAPFPDLRGWINADEPKLRPVLETLDAKGDWVSLYNSSLLTEPLTLSDSIMWLKSCLVKKEDFSQFISDFEEGNPRLSYLFGNSNPNFFSSPRSRMYMDPSSLAWMTWIEENGQVFQVDTVKGNKLVDYPLYKTAAETVHRIAGSDIEYSFQLPSKLLRELLCITEGDGLRYYNKNRQLVAFQSHIGEAYGNRQTLLYVNRELLERALDAHGYKMIWAVRISREPSMKIRDMHKNFFPKRDTSWIVYEDDGELRESMVKDEWSQ